MRRYPFKHMLNVRDLGGYPLSFERATKFGVFLRSDVPVRLEAEETEFLLNKNINTVIDLRSIQELEDMPCAFAGLGGFSYHHVPAWLGGALPKDADAVSALYFELADEKSFTARVFKILANAPGGALFHCTAGKDRTGILAALLLTICGVEKRDIIADYQITHTYIRDMMTKMAEKYPDMSPWLGRSLPEFIEGFFARLEAKYGAVKGYLLEAGVLEEELEKIIIKLTGEI